jgi:chromodomain-helicase-DNA-binding protein 7
MADHGNQILAPYMLRRMKEDVEKSIAPKEETIVEVELTEMQREYYKQIYEVPPSILVFYLFFLILSLSLYR